MLLRHLNSNTGGLSICGLADCLECTEKDVLRAFKHWSKEGLLKIDYDDAGNICGLAVGKTHSVPETEVSMEPSVKEHTATKPSKAKTTPKVCPNQEELRQLYFVAEQYIGKPLSVTEIKKINYFFDTLGLSIDLIEYLIEYCVENGHRSFRYIESVAISWADAGITSVEDAKANVSCYNKNYYAILNAFGIKGRNPAPVEVEFMKKWLEEYGFSLDIILEACNRTINNTHKPDFKYTDTILTNWYNQNVHTLSNIEVLDAAHREQKTTKKRANSKPASNNSFNNFEGRSYDISSLEQQLLNSN